MGKKTFKLRKQRQNIWIAIRKFNQWKTTKSSTSDSEVTKRILAVRTHDTEL